MWRWKRRETMTDQPDPDRSNAWHDPRDHPEPAAPGETRRVIAGPYGDAGGTFHDGDNRPVPAEDIETEVGWAPGRQPTPISHSGPVVTEGEPAPGWTEVRDGPVVPTRDAFGAARIDAPDPVSDSGVHALDTMTSVANTHSVECPQCGGMGVLVKSTSELLRESIGLIDDGDAVVRAFYSRLLAGDDSRAEGDRLAPLFPPDLVTAPPDDELSRGKGQRDKLLKALVALSEMFDPDDEKKMAGLTTALGSFGRSHAAFQRPDGTVRGATLEEYAAVKAVLFGTLVDAAGGAWIPAYTAAWSQAYDFAAAEMLSAQHRSGFTAPRFPRQ